MKRSKAYKHLQYLDQKDHRYQLALTQLIFDLQRRELFEATLYTQLSKRQKAGKNKQILEQIALFDFNHQTILESLTERKAYVSSLKIWLYILASKLLGYTFVVKMMEKKITFPMDNFIKTLLIQHDPHFIQWFDDEEQQEALLLQTLDETRLRYISSMVLGLNDALIEITATLAGFTLSMHNNRMVGVSGVILGVSATLSMAASEYLSNRSENNPKALQAALLCGATYLFVSASLVLPFFMFQPDQKVLAITTMLSSAFFIILFFNFYLSITKDLNFKKRFFEMLVISSIITLISFGVGFLADYYLSINIH